MLFQVMFVFEGLGALCTFKLSVSTRLGNTPLKREKGMWSNGGIKQMVKRLRFAATENKRSVVRCEFHNGVKGGVVPAPGCVCVRSCDGPAACGR